MEDHAGLRTLLREVPVEAGYDVCTAANGGEALDALADFRPCAILLDLRMPVVDGWKFARRCRRLPGADARLIAMTADRGTDLRRELPADDLLAKPYDLDALTDFVARHCRAHRAG